MAVTQAGKLLALKTMGTFVFENELEGENSAFQNGPLTPATLFDLASLTKPLATTTMAMLLYQRGLLDLDAPVIGAVPEFLLDSSGNTDPRRHDVTFRMLLAHSSGLPAYEKLFLKTRSREELLTAAFTTSLSADPGAHAEYSDIGFIILGVALERLAGESIDTFCRTEVFNPLSMSHTTFNPPQELRSNIPPTADERSEYGAGDALDKIGPGSAGKPTGAEPSLSLQKSRSTFRHRIIQGEVQDENAYVLGGVAGHAGLFSTAEDIALFANAVLRSGADTGDREGRQTRLPSDDLGARIFSADTLSLFARRDRTPGSSRALGWDTPSSPSQSGRYFGPNSYGHLGYTGTSLWIDPDRQVSITLLTNRTWPDCSNQAIKQVRPKFHDAVIEALKNQH